MAVRKRIWTTKSGERKEAWVVDYTDQPAKKKLTRFGIGSA